MDTILGLDREALGRWLEERGRPAYRAEQILQWVYQHGVREYRAMSNVPGDLREQLAKSFTLRSSEVVKRQVSADGAVKLLLRWPDGALTETVLMSAGKRRTVCISSQVGCAVGCAFCASGREGLERSLAAGEMVEQVMRVREELVEGERISHVVVMGMGEPLANYEETLKAVRLLNAAWGMGIGARHITISTIGLTEEIRRLAHEPLQITLAVSLHAGDDDLRRTLIPWAKRTTLKDIFDAIDYYYNYTHREVTLEYVLLEGMNSSTAEADRLARWAKKSRCNVNVINYNAVRETGFRPAGKETVRAFMERLAARGVNAHLRRSLGAEIEAACGQLRRTSEEK